MKMLSHHRPRLILAATMAGLVAAPAAHAFGGLFGTIMQMQQQQAAAESAAARQADAQPSKRWGKARPVPDELRQQAQAFAARAPLPSLRSLFERLYIEGERNAVLNWQRIGLAALHEGRLDLAEQAFEQAVTRIDQIYADNEQAQKAKSLWEKEAVKDFKGEPYERAMAMFYRGLVYAARGDFQNARALFKQAEYQDTVAESERYQSDFALMHYMAGWASHCDGDARLAAEYRQRALQADAAYAGISIDPAALVLFETGRAPFKYGAGQHRQALRWAPHPAAEQTPLRACADAGACVEGSFRPAADIGFQATTRGGRQVDAVLEGKARFKDNAKDVADVASTIGAVGLQTAMMTGNRDSAGLGLLGMFVGLAAQAASDATRAQADIREWEQLPGKVWLTTAGARLDAGVLQISLQEGNATVERRAVRLVDAPRCQLYWGRISAPLDTIGEAGPLEPGEHPHDAQFRAGLLGLFGA